MYTISLIKVANIFYLVQLLWTRVDYYILHFEIKENYAFGRYCFYPDT